MTDGTRDAVLGLGERLRSARKARALTLEQAAFAIRLEPSALRALEDERFDELGAAVFVRGHLKAYARLLGMSEEAVMNAYRAADPNADAPAKVTRELEKPMTTTPGPAAIAVAVIVAIVAMLLLYVLSGSKEPAGETPPAPRASQNEETRPTLDPAPAATPTPDAATVPDAATTAEPAEPPDSMPVPTAVPPSSETEPTIPDAVDPAPIGE